MKTKQDMYQKKYNEAMELVADYLGMAVSFLHENLKGGSPVLYQFQKLIKKIEVPNLKEKAFKTYLKKINQLKEKYL